MMALHNQHELAHPSPWLDDLKHAHVERGERIKLIGKHVRVITSYPTFMANAIASNFEYNHQFRDVMFSGTTLEVAYRQQVIFFVLGALELLRPVYDTSEAEDGYVTLEVVLTQARVAYHDSRESFSFDRYCTLAEMGERPQRPFWTRFSTGTPAYTESLYVKGLVAILMAITLPVTMRVIFKFGVARRSIFDNASSDHKIPVDLKTESIKLKDTTGPRDKLGLQTPSSSIDALTAQLEFKADRLLSYS